LSALLSSGGSGVLVWLCCLWGMAAQGQNTTLSRQIIFEKIGRQRVNVFLEDSWGFIWAGTSGLYRYDGYSMEKYAPYISNSEYKTVGTVHALLEDSKKRIWIGASNGLFHYDREHDQIIEHPIKNRDDKTKFGEIISLLEDSKGRLWIGDRQQQIHIMENPDTNVFKTIKDIRLVEMRQGVMGVTSILEDRDGVFYIRHCKTINYRIQFNCFGII